MPSFLIPNSPDGTNMERFLGVINNYGAGLAQSCRFLVRINLPKQMYNPNFGYQVISRDLTYLCEQAELPGKSLTVNDARYYGPMFKYPTQTEYSDITMNFLVRDDMYEKEFFDNWLMSINPTDTYNFSYRDDYVTKIEIYQYSVFLDPKSINTPSSKNKATYCVSLRDAYPTSVAPMPLVWGDEGMHRIAVTFAFTEWNRIDDPVSSGYSLVTTGTSSSETTGSILGGQTIIPSSQTVNRDGKGNQK